MENIKFLKSYLYFAMPIFMIVLVMMFWVTLSSKNDELNLKEFNEGWSYSNGTEANLSALTKNNDYVILNKLVSAEEISDNDFCLRSKNVLFNVYLDNKQLYEFYPETYSFCGKSYGQTFHRINIPNFSGSQMLTIKAKAIYNDSSCFFDYIYTGDGGDYLIKQLKSNLPKFVISIFIFGFGIIMVLIGFSARSYKINTSHVISLGFLALTGATWTSTETMIMQMIFGNSSMVHLLNYYMMMLAAAPFIISVSEIVGNPNTKCIPIIVLTSIINIAASTVLTILNVADYHDLLIITHSILLLSFIMSIYLIIESIIRRRVDKKTYYILGTGSLIASVGVFIDLLLYNLIKNYFSDTGLFVRIGLLCFILVLGKHSLTRIAYMIKLGQKTETVKKLAYTDSLTGLANRMAFTEDEKMFIQNSHNKKIAFVQFDLNGLKMVNDIYGHTAGDNYIKAGSDILLRSFGVYGKCYRMGGDEFISVIFSDNAENDVKNAMLNMQEYINQYNTSNENVDYPLSIACGSAYYDGYGNTIDEIIKMADKVMYEKKKQMKISLNK